VGEDCPLIADSKDHRDQIHLCESDGCKHVRVVLDAGVIFSYYVVAPQRIPSPPILLPSALHAGIGSYCPQGKCIPPSAHGPASEIEWGAMVDGGWQLAYWIWSDGCRLQTAFHRASGTWLAENMTRWQCCAH